MSKRGCFILLMAVCLLIIILSSLVHLRCHNQNINRSPLSHVEKSNSSARHIFTAGPHITTQAIPHKTLVSIAKQINTLQQVVDVITSAEFSSYHFVTPLNQITKGSIIHVAIEAFDKNQQLIKTGGDYWQAVMSTQQPYQASTAGRVVDYNNGTYSVYFYAAWRGHAEISITLVHPSIAVCPYLDDKMWNIGPKVFWDASFKNQISASLKHSKKHTWDTMCWVTLKNLTTNLTCEYPPDGDALGDYTFVCKPPQDGNCRPLNLIALDDDKTTKASVDAVGNQSIYFERQYFNQRLTIGLKRIIILENRGNRESAPELASHSHGYWINHTWTSFLYTDKWTNVKAMRECLQDKLFYLLGDSTTRQWVYYIRDVLQLPEPEMKIEVKDVFFDYKFTKLNLTLIFKFHPQFITKRIYPVGSIRYFANIVDSIKDHECNNTIVLLSPWAHFAQWTRDSLMQRLLKLKEAVLRLRTRCPNIPVLIKGSHLREHPTSVAAYSRSDHTLHKIGQMLKETFADTGALFLDVWDMNLSYPSKKNVHMPKQVVMEEIKLAIPYLCKRLDKL